MDAKSGQIKNGNKSEIFSAPVDVQESANETTNAFDVGLIVQFWVHLIIHLELHLLHFIIYIKVQKRCPEIALNVVLLVGLKLHLFMQLKGEIEVAFYAALEGASKISF